MERITLESGIELDVQITGPEDAPPIIFLHGFPESHRTWRYQIKHFSDRYRCIVPDQRGYRGSSKPQDVNEYATDKLIADVFQLADQLNVKSFTLVGHDWGGAIAWGAALLGQTTGRVNRLVIMNAPHPVIFQKLQYTNPIQRKASQYIRAFRDTSNDDEIRSNGLADYLARTVNWNALQYAEKSEQEETLKDWQDGESAIAMLNWYRATPMAVPPLDAPYELPEDNPIPSVPAITIPTLVIWGEDDTALPPVNLYKLSEQVEDYNLVKIPGCGHFVTWSEPTAVNNAMDDFFKAHA